MMSDMWEVHIILNDKIGLQHDRVFEPGLAGRINSKFDKLFYM